jgi:hypothetical protein
LLLLLSLIIIYRLTCQQLYGTRYVIFEWIPLEPQLHHHDAHTPHISRRVIGLSYKCTLIQTYINNLWKYFDIRVYIHNRCTNICSHSTHLQKIRKAPLIYNICLGTCTYPDMYLIHLHMHIISVQIFVETTIVLRWIIRTYIHIFFIPSSLSGDMYLKVPTEDLAKSNNDDE